MAAAGPGANAHGHAMSPTLAIGLALAFPLARWVLHVFVFQPAAHTMLGSAPQHKAATVHSHQRRCEKLCESFWKLLVYSTFLCVGVLATAGEPWLLDTRLYWQGWPHQPFSAAARVLYYGELGFYLSSFFMLLVWEVRRKDFAAMLTHHVITAALLAGSLHHRFWRVGCVVMVLHDANDVLMEAAKVAIYCRANNAATGLFAAFVVSWVALRLTAFPLMVVRSTLAELPAALGGRPPLYWGFNAGLLALLALHCYWFTLIARVAYTALQGKLDDVREDDSDDEGGG